MGQAWVYGMVVPCSSSLFCAKDGFRPFIFGFLTFCVVNLIIGHSCIRAYQRDMDRQNQKTADAGSTSPPRLWLKTVHGFTMILSFIMLFGAGVMFTIRSKSLGKCMNYNAIDDSLDELPTLIWKE